VTPKTLTVCLSNYCQNHCSYCVSRSHGICLDPPKHWDVYKPKGFEHLNTRELDLKFGIRWYRDKCPDKIRYIHPKNVLDVSWIERWLNKYTPNTILHLSGGEPLLRPDIEEIVERLLRNHEIIVFTNGQFISQRPRLLSLPIYWVVTWHQSQIQWDDWYENVKLIDPSQATFYIARQHLTIDDIDKFASVTNLIDPNGKVFAYNTRQFEQIGDIYLDTYHPKNTQTLSNNLRHCAFENTCDDTLIGRHT
jgi:organic radical activating enzyme